MINLKHKIVRYPKIFSNAIYKVNTDEKHLYLSFDDGPTPDITDRILEILDNYNAKASFFCLGKNADEQQHIFEKINKAKHCIGNHSYSHKNAFKIDKKKWIEDALKHSAVVNAKFFRPPYGAITPTQFKILSEKYKIVFWSLMTYDFYKNYTSKDIIQIIEQNIKNGDIIVFHDNDKANNNMFEALNFILKKYSNLDYKFKTLNDI